MLLRRGLWRIEVYIVRRKLLGSSKGMLCNIGAPMVGSHSLPLCQEANIQNCHHLMVGFRHSPPTIGSPQFPINLEVATSVENILVHNPLLACLRKCSHHGWVRRD